MANTKRRRRTKHRGNAAGVVEVRGRTGRKPTASERKADARATAREQRLARLDQPPTWRAAANRAAITALIFAVALVLVFKRPVGAAFVLAALMLLVYIPMGYSMDSWLYRRRQRQKGGRS
jgi:hypothetical protein